MRLLWQGGLGAYYTELRNKRIQQSLGRRVL